MQIFGATSNQVQERQFNVFVGISIGNKRLTPDMAKDYTEWAMQHSSGTPTILIADKIASVNYQVLHGFDEHQAAEKARNKGVNFEQMFKRAIKRLALDEAEATEPKIIKWDDITNERYEHLYEVLVKEFESNADFKRDVLFFVHEYLKHSNNSKPLNDDDLDKLADYILAELPALLEGIQVGGVVYDLLFYPTYRESGMSQFVVDLQDGKYQRLADELALERRNVMMESYIEN